MNTNQEAPKAAMIAPRQRIGRGLALLSTALLCGAPLALAVAWAVAFRDGWMPEAWGVFEGNHGPWRHYSIGRDMVEYAMMFPLESFLAALVSLPFKPTKLAVIMLMLSVFVFFGVVGSHFWLID